MSFVTTQPEGLSTAAGDLASIGSAMSALNAAAAGLTTEVIPAAADQVSATTAVRFATHAQMYQLVSAQAAAVHEQFVAMLSSTAGSYATAEASNAAATGLGGV
jgi:PE family